MKKIILLAVLFLLHFCTFAQLDTIGLTSIIVEKYYVSDSADAAAADADQLAAQNQTGTLPIGSVTYRIYADMLPGYKFQALYGIPSPLHNLIVKTSTQFYNNSNGDDAPNWSKTSEKNNVLMLDSWFSVGAASNGQVGVLKADDNGASNNVTVANNSLKVLLNSDLSAGIPLTTQDGMMAGSPQSVTFVGFSNELSVFTDGSTVGNLFTTDNGSIASLNGSSGGDTLHQSNKLLIGQFTTDGSFHFELNVQIGTPSGGTQNYVASNPQPGELQVPGLIFDGCPLPIANANSKSVPVKICKGDSETYTASGGVSYLWYDDAGDTLSKMAALTVKPLNNGNYLVQVFNSSGCNAWDSVMVTVNPVPTINPNIGRTPLVFCSGTSETYTANGGVAYLWFDVKKDTLSKVAALTINPDSATTYRTKVTGSNGCSAWDSIQVAVNALPKIDLVSVSNVKCFGNRTGSLSVNVSGGSSPYTYSWNNGGTDSIISGLKAAGYTLTATDKNDCSASVTYSVTQPSSALTAASNVNKNTAIADASGGTFPYSYLWTPGNATTDSVKGLANGKYDVVITDDNGCTVKDSVTIDILGMQSYSGSSDNIRVYPNPVSGLLMIDYAGSENAVITILNVLGAEVYSVTSENTNGIVHKSIDMSGLPAGSYLISIRSSDRNLVRKIIKE